MATGALAQAAPRSIPAQSVGTRRASSYLRESAWVAAVLVLTFGAFVYRLSSVVISDMDEGTYLYAGKLLAQGLVPYRDFLLAHPPLVVLLAAGWERLAGADIMSARLAYLTLVLLTTIPLYLIGRRLTRSAAGGLLAVVTYTTGMLLLANMGRTVRLEPIMNAFLIGGFWLSLREGGPRTRALVGTLFACALLVKLVAIVPIAFLILGDLLWGRRGWRFVKAWASVAVGGAIVLIPATLVLLAQPHFIEDVLLSQLTRPGLPTSLRAFYLIQDLERFPPIAIALIAAAWAIVRGRDAQLRMVALVCLGGTLGLVFAFRTFFGYYLVQTLPWLAILFAVATCWALGRLMRARAGLATSALVVVLGLLVPLAYGEYYFRTAHDHVASPAAIVPLLEQKQGPMYAMYPSFALWANRPEVAWYYAADSLIPRLTGDMRDAEFIQAFSASDSVVVFSGELTEYPTAAAYLNDHFQLRYHDDDYALWERS